MTWMLIVVSDTASGFLARGHGEGGWARTTKPRCVRCCGGWGTSQKRTRSALDGSGS